MCQCILASATVQILPIILLVHLCVPPQSFFDNGEATKSCVSINFCDLCVCFSSVLCTIFMKDDANHRMDSLSDILDRLEEHECHGVEVVIEPPLNAVAEVTDEDSENEDGDNVNVYLPTS